MFTGLIEEVGTITGVTTGAGGREMRIQSGFRDLVDGESIAVNGACLTVREHENGAFTVGAVETTLERTTLGSLNAGRRVNLERALQLGARLGGHMVAGHVDSGARVTSVEQRTDATIVSLAVPQDVLDVSVLHGSITVDGVSLTVNDLLPDGIELSLIEYTLRHTTLADLKAGDDVNVEADMVGKYVQRLLQPHRG
jgi:riboflavin synthase